MNFTDGSSETVEAIICATGYDVDIPYLSDLVAPDLPLYQRTFDPDLPGLAFVGQFFAQGPYFPLLELQARWVTAVWSGAVALPGDATREPPPPIDAHNALALTLAEHLGVEPDRADWPDLAEPLLHGPMLPPHYRLSGHGARPDASVRFVEQLASSPRAPSEEVALVARPLELAVDVDVEAT